MHIPQRLHFNIRPIVQVLEPGKVKRCISPVLHGTLGLYAIAIVTVAIGTILLPQLQTGSLTFQSVTRIEVSGNY